MNARRDGAKGQAGALLAALGDAKRRLLASHASLVEIEQRTRDWDVREKFLARRGLELRRSAHRAFAAELGRMKEAIEQTSSGLAAAAAPRPTLLEMRRQLRALHLFFGSSELPLLRLIREVDRALDLETRPVS